MTHLMRNVAWILGSLALIGCYRPPTENQLLENFESHRSEFDKLLAMGIADKIFHRISAGEIPPRGMPDTRFREYLIIFKRLGIENGVNWGIPGSPDGFFVISSSSVPIGGKSRLIGYVYCSVPPDPVVPHLLISHFPFEIHKGNGRHIVFRQLQDHWYLFYFAGW